MKSPAPSRKEPPSLPSGPGPGPTPADAAGAGPPGADDLIVDHLDVPRMVARSVARRLGWHGAAREDLEQEGMLGLIEAARTYDPARGASFATWAGTVAHRVIVDAVRREIGRRRYRPRPRGVARRLDLLSAPGDSPDRAAERADTAARVSRAVDALPAAHAETVRHRFGLGGRRPVPWGVAAAFAGRSHTWVYIHGRPRITERLSELLRDYREGGV